MFNTEHRVPYEVMMDIMQYNGTPQRERYDATVTKSALCDCLHSEPRLVSEGKETASFLHRR